MTFDQVKRDIRYSIGEFWEAYEFESAGNEVEIDKAELTKYDPSTRIASIKLYYELENDKDLKNDDILGTTNIDLVLVPMFSNLTEITTWLSSQTDPNLDTEDIAEIYDDHFKTNIEKYFDDDSGTGIIVDNDTAILGYALPVLKISVAGQQVSITLDETNKVFAPSIALNAVFYDKNQLTPK